MFIGWSRLEWPFHQAANSSGVARLLRSNQKTRWHQQNTKQNRRRKGKHILSKFIHLYHYQCISKGILVRILVVKTRPNRDTIQPNFPSSTFKCIALNFICKKWVAALISLRNTELQYYSMYVFFVVRFFIIFWTCFWTPSIRIFFFSMMILMPWKRTSCCSAPTPRSTTRTEVLFTKIPSFSSQSSPMQEKNWARWEQTVFVTTQDTTPCVQHKTEFVSK